MVASLDDVLAAVARVESGGPQQMEDLVLALGYYRHMAGLEHARTHPHGVRFLVPGTELEELNRLCSRAADVRAEIEAYNLQAFRQWPNVRLYVMG